MTDIATTSPLAPAGRAPAPGAATAKGSSTSALSSDFETFLKMLTTQMQNQDPLQPMESAEFSVQLATFSGVEQQVQTNDLLRQMTSAIGAGGLAEMAALVGREVRAAVPAQFDGSPVALTFTPRAEAERTELVVRDSTGAEVQRRLLPRGESTVTWTGTGADGTAMPRGLYSFEVVSQAGETVIDTQVPRLYARVDEVQSTPAGTVLILAGGTAVSQEEVDALRAPAL
ncbi:flagellar hook capping FlgD N-terminal domain-containing protein [Pseudoroseicyclus aestuarii]|uniref:Basal-body rod modification protein FlgD n=1 Tax=Pseudoroseicyclus aestuarii TaxID=1795041 RepID=A0A318T2X2_9RHOB|nr:flagellar hook capping FlgD N-terminal domain-containing protein [Pseudoroseicyclus aestuarii]PYE84564.1 flagellar basal-body rod modification protein FlgD [Pseudoroseicyclus aestuarii]